MVAPEFRKTNDMNTLKLEPRVFAKSQILLLVTIAVICLMLVFSPGCEDRKQSSLGWSKKTPDDKSVTVLSERGFENGVRMKMICLSTGYYVSKFETRQDQFEKIMGYNPSETKGSDLPVDYVTAGEATEFCTKLTEYEHAKRTLPEGYVYALPTFAQWLEFLAGAPVKGSVTPYGEHDKWTEEHALPVGSGEKNRLGIYDLRGNVEEWSSELYDKDYGYVILGSSFVRYRRDSYDYSGIKNGTVDLEAGGTGSGFRCILVKE